MDYHLLITLVLMFFFGHGLACKCALPSVQERYCNADFVLKVRVKSGLINLNGQQDFDDYYKISILEQWKFNNPVYDLTRVYTGTNSAMCGVTLTKGKTYVISGSVDLTQQRMEINTCSSLVEQAPFSQEVMNLKTNPPTCP